MYYSCTRFGGCVSGLSPPGTGPWRLVIGYQEVGLLKVPGGSVSSSKNCDSASTALRIAR